MFVKKSADWESGEAKELLPIYDSVLVPTETYLAVGFWPSPITGHPDAGWFTPDLVDKVFETLPFITNNGYRIQALRITAWTPEDTPDPELSARLEFQFSPPSIVLVAVAADDLHSSAGIDIAVAIYSFGAVPAPAGLPSWVLPVAIGASVTALVVVGVVYGFSRK